jgi:hypothetical protein
MSLPNLSIVTLKRSSDGDYDLEVTRARRCPVLQMLLYNYDSSMNGMRHAVDPSRRMGCSSTVRATGTHQDQL